MVDAKSVVRLLRRRRLTVAVAESFTGGRLQDVLTNVSGSSGVFVGGVVAYHNRVKTRTLGVPTRLLARRGAVSPEVALTMARAARRLWGADVGIATTGIAGPTGATPGKPIGLSIVAAVRGRRALVDRRVHRGNRQAVKSAAVRQALRLVRQLLGHKR